MARNEIFISAAPRQVWEILADPRSYAHWVFGSREIEAADPHTAAAGHGGAARAGPGGRRDPGPPLRGEGPARRLISLLAGPLVHGAIGLRNVESLTRREELAEGTTPRAHGRLSRRGEQGSVPPVRARGQRLASAQPRATDGGR